MQKQVIHSDEAPQPIGCYSQGIRVGNTAYFSGQIPLDPQTGQIVAGDFRAQVTQVFKNMQVVAKAAGGDLNAIVKLTVYLTEMTMLSTVNEVMGDFFQKPYPARTSITVAALPKNAAIEVEGVMVVG